MPYPQRYVAYMDILGFSDIVKSTASDDFRLDALRKALEQINAREHDAKFGGADFQFQTFSDSIVMSAADKLEGQLYILYAVKNLVLVLLQNGLLTRGAITKGGLHHIGPIMFGPAFIEAYRVEQAIAKFPRIIIGEPLFKELKAVAGGLINPRFVMAEDGPPFLDVLQDIGELNTEAAPEEIIVDPDVADARLCQDILQGLIDRSIHDPKHFEKTTWFGLYWNKTVGFRPNALIRPVDFPSSRNVTWRQH